MLRILGLAIICIVITMTTAIAHNNTENEQFGWKTPYLGQGKGSWDASVGAFFWKDSFHLRNLQLRTDVDLYPGVRWHSIVRSNREQDSLRGGQPHFDENYLELFAFNKQQEGALSASLRVGTSRYLHFPFPDAIGLFDQVPGISDLKGGAKTGYSGELLSLDYAHHSGLGVHYSGINWGFGRTGGSQSIEKYLYYRTDIGQVHLETHIGGLAVRPEPLGRMADGHNVYAGTTWKGYTIGLLYEKLHNNPVYTGLMVSFPMNKTTKAMGRVAFDYDRSPEGFALQIPLAKGFIGDVKKKAPVNGSLVGEIKAERTKTYWQNGQVRNYYEHRVSQWGEVGQADLVMVAEEQPWYLKTEALVSPHTFSEGAKTWEKDRQGPAHLTQKVIYKFYKTNTK